MSMTQEEAICLVVLALKNTAPELLQGVVAEGCVTGMCRAGVEIFWDRHAQGLVTVDTINLLILALKAASFGDWLVADGEAGPELRKALNLFLETGGYAPVYE